MDPDATMREVADLLDHQAGEPAPAPSTANARLTPARRRGLVVLATGDHADRPVYESNQTSHPTAARLTVYWKTVRWVREHGYATTAQTRQGLRVILTSGGRDLARTVLDGDR
jgi:hypothetical protein